VPMMATRRKWRDVARDWPPAGGAKAALEAGAALFGREPTSVYLELPWPPTLNTYWRHVVVGGRARVVISSKGRAYRQSVIDAVVRQTQPDRRSVAGRLAVDILASPPDKRRRDLDNLPKAVLDALEHAGVYADDADIDELRIRRVAHPTKAAGLEVSVSRLADVDDAKRVRPVDGTPTL